MVGCATCDVPAPSGAPVEPDLPRLDDQRQETTGAGVLLFHSGAVCGGVAVEDLAVGDLNGDGKPDIVAVGRATKNVKIYWNGQK